LTKLSGRKDTFSDTILNIDIGLPGFSVLALILNIVGCSFTTLPQNDRRVATPDFSSCEGFYFPR